MTVLKLEIDQLDTGNLETTPADLSQLKDAVKYNVLKKTEFNKLVKKLIPWEY